MSLRVFLGLDPIPSFKVKNISREAMHKLYVKPEVCAWYYGEASKFLMRLDSLFAFWFCYRLLRFASI